MLYFLPLPRYSCDVGSCFQKSLHGVRTGQRTAQASEDFHGHTVGVRQSFRVPEGFRPQATLAEFGGKHPLGGHVPDTGTIFGRLLPPPVAPHLLLNSLRPRDERGHQMKMKCSGQKRNQHRSQMYDLRRRVYQISWNIWGRRLVIPGSFGSSGKMWD